jgi:hypothetical protein
MSGFPPGREEMLTIGRFEPNFVFPIIFLKASVFFFKVVYLSSSGIMSILFKTRIIRSIKTSAITKHSAV